MNIIFVSDKLARPRTFTLRPRQFALIALVWVLLPLLLAAGLFYYSLYHAPEIKSAYFQSIIHQSQEAQLKKNRAYLQTNLNAIAVRVGEMQAQMTRLDALGSRLAKMAGINKEDFQFGHPPARGGVSDVPEVDLSRSDLQHQIDVLARRMEDRSDRLMVLEAMLQEKSISKSAFPSFHPVRHGYISSPFGWRIDPINGKREFHEGVDFMVRVGTPVLAAANGVVTYARFNPFGYGNLVAINHGNGLVTRYAHCSKLLVKEGDIVLRGQEIALSGDTGRSTGPHLHFEVRYHGVPQNPISYLKAVG
ncbi:MAG TPA: peptidase M23 [Betaproteobacteria bacterium]|nr:peptidase M23 [Betaproteobacteria bacterium]